MGCRRGRAVKSAGQKRKSVAAVDSCHLRIGSSKACQAQPGNARSKWPCSFQARLATPPPLLNTPETSSNINAPTVVVIKYMTTGSLQKAQRLSRQYQLLSVLVKVPQNLIVEPHSLKMCLHLDPLIQSYWTPELVPSLLGLNR